MSPDGMSATSGRRSAPFVLMRGCWLAMREEGWVPEVINFFELATLGGSEGDCHRAENIVYILDP